jgi:hypothetical protein
VSAVGVRDDLVEEPRLFSLVRTDDVSGVSGTGRVADGVQWPDGTVTFRWRTAKATTVMAASIEDVQEIHGHDGRTKVVWWSRDIGTDRPLGVITAQCHLEATFHPSHIWSRFNGTSEYDVWCPGLP